MFKWIDQFIAALSAFDIVVPGQLAIGRMARANVGHHAKGKNDAVYVFNIASDGKSAWGGFQNHHDGLGWQTWSSKESEQTVRAPLVIFQDDYSLLLKRRQAAARRARSLWDEAQPTITHPYLQGKRVGCVSGLRVGNWTNGKTSWQGALLIPILEEQGRLDSITSLQAISVDGEKQLLWGGAKAGNGFCVGVIDETSGPLYLAEGYATAYSVARKTGCPCVMAVDAGNLVHMALKLRYRYRHKRIIVAADYDHAGLAAANQVANALSCEVIVPPCPGIDFNDVWR